MQLTALHRNPFLRLLLPFISGLICGDELFFLGKIYWSGNVYLWIILSGFLLLSVLFRWQRYSLRWLFGGFLFVYLFVIGMGCAAGRLQSVKRTFSLRETVYLATLTEHPDVKENSILCHVTIQQPSYTNKLPESTFSPCHVLLYLYRDSLSEQLVRGDELMVSTRIVSPVNNGNFDEFDYARYLLRKGISGTGFAYSGYWRRVGHFETYSFRQRALDFREHVLDMYRRLGFDKENFAVLSALTVGYKEELGEEIRESYSIAGASHVLALSGLHIGFLYALLFWSLKKLPGRWRGVKLIRTLVIILALWAFAFLTGLSASVVRSVCMFSLFAWSGLSGRKNHTFNTLAATAFFMLLICPGWLFDVGFQLSFLAVASILLFYPLLYRQVSVTNRIGRYVWGLICVSIAAQIGTAPLVLYYFSRFSTHFLLTNLLVIPLVSLILYTAVILLLLTSLPLFQTLVGSVLKMLVEGLNTSVRWVEHLPGASVDRVWITPFELLAVYLLLYWVYRVWTNRTGRNLIAVLVCLFIVGGYHTFMSMTDSPSRQILFYNVRNCPAVHCIATGGKSWLALAGTLSDTSRLQRVMSKHWNHLRLDQPHEVFADYKEGGFSCHNHLISFCGHRVCVLNDGYWRNKKVSCSLSIDYLYICKGYKGTLKELMPLFNIHQVILDSSLSMSRCRFYQEECCRLRIPCLSLSDKGSVRFML